MSGLIIKLAPNERILINGAVIENSDSRAKFTVRTPDTKLLRLRDAIHPEEVKSPLLHLCYICQMVLCGDIESDLGRKQVLAGLEQLSRIFLDDDSQKILSDATITTVTGSYYRTLKNLRLLLPREARYLAACS